jgi:hypothetical protein
MPLPVSTLAAWISTSETSVARSGANVRVASHLSKVPFMATACCLTNFGECRHILDDVHFLNARWIEVPNPRWSKPRRLKSALQRAYRKLRPRFLERGTGGALYRSSIVIPSSTWRGTRSRVSWSRAAPYVQRPIVQRLISWSDWMLYMRPSGSPASVETIFRLGFAAVFPKDSAAPVPIETINGFRFPSSTDRLLGSRSVSKNAGLLCGLTPPSTNTNILEESLRYRSSTSGGKNT